MYQVIGSADEESIIKKLFGPEADIEAARAQLQQIQGQVQEVEGELTEETFETILKKVGEDGKYTAEELKKLIITLQQGKKDIAAVDSTPPKKEPQDWSKMATAALRAGSAITSMSNSMDAFYENAKKGNLTLGNLLSSFTSIGYAAMTMSSMFKEGGAIAEAVAASGGVIPQ